MERKELRIGNYFIDDSGEETTLIFVDYDCLYWDYCAPIKLTEEWLVKFGFIHRKGTLIFKIKSNDYWSLGELKQGYLKLKLTGAGGFRVENFANKSITLKYVHQLQNLFFSITEREL